MHYAIFTVYTESVYTVITAKETDRRKPERKIKMKTYYIADNAEFYGSESPVCIDMTEVKRLASEWGYESADQLLEQMHEADENEISEFGTYDSDCNE